MGVDEAVARGACTGASCCVGNSSDHQFYASLTQHWLLPFHLASVAQIRFVAVDYNYLK